MHMIKGGIPTCNFSSSISFLDFYPSGSSNCTYDNKLYSQRFH